MILPGLHSSNLISLGQLCDDGCSVLLSSSTLSAIKDNKVILRGYRNPSDGLWDIPICANAAQSNPPSFIPSMRTSHKLAVIINKKQTATDLVQYLHAACFSPTVTTWTQAIKNNNFVTWPGLTTELVRKHLPRSQATSQGHLHRERANLQSTKTTPSSLISQPTCSSMSPTEDFFPQTDKPKPRTHHSIYAMLPTTDITVGYQDLTGRFPQRSSRGNEYILVGYHSDGNYIHGIPVKNRTASVLTHAWEKLHRIFSKVGTAPSVWVLDNEISADLITAFTKQTTEYQLVPPHSHRRNQAERAIQTYKNHFKAGLASMDPQFPLSEWDRVIPQANITLNLLRAARSNPNLSAHAYIHGTFNFAATPLAPPGTKVVVYLDNTQRGTWDLNGEPGWYVGPAMKHYRCVSCYFPRTRTTRICDTVAFFPHTTPFPKVTLSDHLRQAAEDIIHLLTHPPTSTVPSLQAGDPVRQALTDLATQLQRIEPIPSPVSTPRPAHSPTNAVVPPHEGINPTPSHIDVGPLPRVPVHPPKNRPLPPRVEPIIHPPVTPLSTLQTHDPNIKSVRFPAKPTHNYTLRSKMTPFHTPRILTRSRLQRRQDPFSLRPRYQLAAQFLQHQQHETKCIQWLQHHFLHPRIHHIFRPDGTKETIDTILRGSDRDIWTKSLSNEWGRLAQGNHAGVNYTDTIDFIRRNDIPSGRKITYATFVLDYRPLKSEPHRIRITVGGDRLTYPFDTGSPAANLLETKLLLNSTISDAHRGSRFMSADLKNFFLATPMARDEFMRVKLQYFPADICTKYDLASKVAPDGYVYIRIKKGMYGLKQAALLAYNHLKQSLASSGYAPIVGTAGLWAHATRATKFCLCVDDFGIKYFSKDDADHLLASLSKHYQYTTDWTGTNYCGLTLDWHYQQGYVDISMPAYVKNSLKRFNHSPSKSPQYSPHAHFSIQYGQGTRQYATAPDLSPPLSPADTTHIQSVIGTYLYYGRALDHTILPALNSIASAQSAPTQNTKKATQQLMDYVATYPNAYLRYYASDMVLHVDSDAAYLVAPNARSRISGYFHLSDHPNITKHPKLNGAILVECKTLRHVVSSSAEAEVAGIYHNATVAVPIRHILHALHHPQPPTPLKTDNSTAAGFVYDNIHQKRSKSWDMRYHWLRDRQTQEQFNIFWDKGINNEADYTTKHHPPAIHLQNRPRYIHDKLKNILHSFTTSPKIWPQILQTESREGVLVRPGLTTLRPTVWPPDPNSGLRRTHTRT